MNYQEYFNSFRKKFEGIDVSDIKEHLAFQFDITDEDCGGIFYVEILDGILFIEPFDYKDRDAEFICSTKTLNGIADGKVDPVKAFLSGDLKIEGSTEKALRFKELVARKAPKKPARKPAVKKTAAKKPAAKKPAAKKPAAKKTAEKKPAAKKPAAKKPTSAK